MSIKNKLSKLVPTSLWAYIRKRKIIAHHKKVAAFCSNLIETYYKADNKGDVSITPKKSFDTDKIIWQYWGQGFDNLPKTVEECFCSVEKWKCDFIIVRLSDDTIGDYIEFPQHILDKRKNMSRAYFSDLLRVSLLSTYGGVWLDATIYLSNYLPDRYFDADYFLYQRDPDEQNKDYWENTYAYYFGWDKDYSVNMLSSVIFARKGSRVITDICRIMIYYWETATNIPDYFFLQILYDVIVKRFLTQERCSIESDCLPHYLQQLRNDPSFSLATEEEILRNIPIHKLTYK